MSRRGPYRLATGGRVDRSRAVRFSFDGRELSGLEGDTVASALLANGVRVVGRSFKYHRPRGIFSAGVEEPNALVRLHRGAHVVPSARATITPLSASLAVGTHTGWPSVRFDLFRVLDFVKPLFAAGFYNKTFIWPAWHWYEGAIRRMAGLGLAPEERDPSRYHLRNIHCEVLIVGGGVAGLRAAAEAAQRGARVLLVEQESELGGAQRWDGSGADGQPSRQWIESTLRRLAENPDVKILTRTTATSYHEHNVLGMVERVGEDTTVGLRERYWVVRTKRIVLATGAIEQPLIFSNNDRPGIMLAGAARRYLHGYGVAPGRRVVVATNNDSAYAAALDLRQAGVDIAAVLDSRPAVSQDLVTALQQRQITLRTGVLPVDTSGFGALKRVTAGCISEDGERVLETFGIEANALLVSGGWSPTLHLLAQAGGKLQYDGKTGALEPAMVPPAFELVGAAAGIEGQGAYAIGPRVSPVGDTNAQWVDLRHDVVVSDLELAQRENFTSIEHVKRHTTVGMSVDQGKTSNAAALQIVGRIRGKAPSELGYTTLRPPFMPVTLGAIAARDIGERFAPARHSPLHAWHASHGALLEDYGEWKRPAAYLRTGETRADAIRREARAVRTSGGIYDGSSLGKIEIHGPDAKDFLDRFYINNLLTLQPGKARYGLMLRENGVIFDDGTVVALAPDRLLMTTTSGGALRVGAWLEDWRQCEWPNLRVSITPVTDQWATVALTGVHARTLLQRLRPDFDVSNEAFPHLGMREGRVLGMPARIYRVSFSGELTYEINVPASSALTLWETLLQEGGPLGITPYGLESLMLMRLEKGFLHIGSDTDGTTVPDDVGWGKVAANKSKHYIGKRSLSLAQNVRADRLQLVGLQGVGAESLPMGSHLLLRGRNSARPSDGWITSAGRGSLDDKPIALAMLSAGRAAVGREVTVHDGGRLVCRAEVVAPSFYDPTGARMNA
jgi:sarcosine oxidase subunit alpha